MTLRIGSLCAGVGGLDLAVSSVLDAELAWYAQYEPPDKDGKPDRHQYAARIMAHHWPGVPNHGDITAIDYAGVERVDILTAGWPCQDMSLAGLRKGMMPGTRSGLWAHVARAIGELRPSLVILENVRSLTSAKAHSDLEQCPWCLGEAGHAEPALRALGCVLGDLADLGFDAQWQVLPASAAGAPHERERTFVLAWPAAQDPDLPTRHQWRPAAPVEAQGGGARPDARGRGGVPLPAAALSLLPTPAARDWKSGASNLLGANSRPLNEVAVMLLPTPKATDGPHGGPSQRDAAGRYYLPGMAPRLDADWVALDGTDYGPAIRRWEAVIDRPAPCPTEPGTRGNRRLSPAFVEWMMGLPGGWVTAVPGVPRNPQLHALGNGVVPQQGAMALWMLLAEYEAANQPPGGSGLIRNATHQQTSTDVTCGDSERAA